MEQSAINYNTFIIFIKKVIFFLHFLNWGQDKTWLDNPFIDI